MIALNGRRSETERGHALCDASIPVHSSGQVINERRRLRFLQVRNLHLGARQGQNAESRNIGTPSSNYRPNNHAMGLAAPGCWGGANAL
jgi:hypothetical protein